MWSVVILITLFLGLRYEEKDDISPPNHTLTRQTYLYGYLLACNSVWAAIPNDGKPEFFQKNRSLLWFPKYKYQLIVATLLIGFALAVSVKEK